MNEHYDKLDQEYQLLQKQFQLANKNKCAKCIQAIIKRMTEIDMEQAKILGQPLNSRPELQLNVRC
jgi:hypothetical protein